MQVGAEGEGAGAELGNEPGGGRSPASRTGPALATSRRDRGGGHPLGPAGQPIEAPIEDADLAHGCAQSGRGRRPGNGRVRLRPVTGAGTGAPPGLLGDQTERIGEGRAPATATAATENAGRSIFSRLSIDHRSSVIRAATARTENVGQIGQDAAASHRPVLHQTRTTTVTGERRVGVPSVAPPQHPPLPSPIDGEGGAVGAHHRGCGNGTGRTARTGD